jgi:hypothetical protein
VAQGPSTSGCSSGSGNILLFAATPGGLSSLSCFSPSSVLAPSWTCILVVLRMRRRIALSRSAYPSQPSLDYILLYTTLSCGFRPRACSPQRRWLLCDLDITYHFFTGAWVIRMSSSCLFFSLNSFSFAHRSFTSNHRHIFCLAGFVPLAICCTTTSLSLLCCFPGPRTYVILSVWHYPYGRWIHDHLH